MSARDGRRVLSQEERTLWAAVTKAITPLNAAVELLPGENVAAHVDAAKPQKPATTKPSSPPVAAPPPLAPLGRRLKQRVARGKEAIDARLDLHGLTQSEAHAVLLRFLKNAQARDARLVLVITGKGVRGEGERGVLKRQVPHWLGLPEFRAMIVGFEDAHVAHGGEGALYVRVRRARG
jgi:DNA-nicking Smr family endonuclease